MLTHRRGRRQPDEAGFSLIEVTVASSILVTVLAVFMGLLVSLTNNEHRSQNLVSNEQNVRFELDQLQRDVRAANPLVTFPSKSTYGNALELQLGATGGAQTVVRWFYDTNPASPTYESLVRQVMSDTSQPGTVTSTTNTLIHVRNTESSRPVFSYFGQHEGDLVAGSYTAADVANCSIRVHVLVISDSNPGPLPFQEQLDVELRNRLPGGIGCG